MSKIVIHNVVESEELIEAVRAAAKGVVVEMTREAISEIVGQEVSNKVGVVVNQPMLERLMREEIRKIVTELFKERTMFGAEGLHPDVAKIIRSEVNAIVNERLNRGKLL